MARRLVVVVVVALRGRLGLTRLSTTPRMRSRPSSTDRLHDRRVVGRTGTDDEQHAVDKRRQQLASEISPTGGVSRITQSNRADASVRISLHPVRSQPAIGLDPASRPAAPSGSATLPGPAGDAGRIRRRAVGQAALRSAGRRPRESTAGAGRRRSAAHALVRLAQRQREIRGRQASCRPAEARSRSSPS